VVHLTEGQLYAFDPETARTALSAIAPDRFVAAIAGKKPTF
jgi:hypothetical protein